MLGSILSRNDLHITVAAPLAPLPSRNLYALPSDVELVAIHIPEPNRLVPTPAGQGGTIGRKRHRGHRLLVTFQEGLDLVGFYVPQPDFVSVCSG